MSSHHAKPTLVDRFWPLGLILFGGTFIAVLALFHPAL
jgi:hypothetical protein